MMIGYWIKHRRSGELYERRSIIIPDEEVIEAFKDQFTSPIHLNMDDDWKYDDCEVSDGQKDTS